MTKILIKSILELNTSRSFGLLFTKTKSWSQLRLFSKDNRSELLSCIYKSYLNTFYRMMSNTIQPKIIFVLGGPGAGKGTQCQKIVNQFGFVHLSAGDLLREERIREGSEFGILIDDYIKNGKIVPVEVTCSLLENAMKLNMKLNKTFKFLIDGFPRNQDNLDGWNRKMSDKVDFQFVLFFDCSENVCVERCLNRGKSGSGRSDDNMESMKKRIQTYNNESFPIIEHFRKQNLVKQINASFDADKVFEQVEAVLSEAKL